MTSFWKLLADSRGNLSIRHLVGGFNTNYAPCEPFPRQTCFELYLCFTGTKDQDGFRVANTRYYMIIVFVEVAREACVSLVFCRVLLCRTRISDVLLHA